MEDRTTGEYLIRLKIEGIRDFIIFEFNNL